MSERMSILLEVNDDGTMVVRNFAQAAEREAQRAATAVSQAFGRTSTAAAAAERSLARVPAAVAESQKAFSTLGAHVDRTAGRLATLGRLAAGVFAGMAVRSSIGFAAEFERRMSAVKAVTGETAQRVGELAARARELSGSSGVAFNANEAASAIQNLGLAGFKASQIMTILLDVLSAVDLPEECWPTSSRWTFDGERCGAENAAW